MHNYKIHILAFFFITNGFSQKPIVEDTTNITVTPFKENIKERYSSNDFNYDINDTGGVNLLQQAFRKFFKWVGDTFGFDVDFIDYQTLEVIVYVLLGILALYLLIKFLIDSPINTVFKPAQNKIESFNFIEEDIVQIDFDKLINNAIKGNNYRLATRYLYLKCLKVLTNKNIINWDFDKTNSDYINEIKDPTTKAQFKNASKIYDYVWYGEFPIDKESYQNNKQHFNKLETL